MLQLVIQVIHENIQIGFFAVKIDTQKLRFWKLSIKNRFHGKKVLIINISDCATSTSIPLSPLKAELNFSLYVPVHGKVLP